MTLATVTEIHNSDFLDLKETDLIRHFCDSEIFILMSSYWVIFLDDSGWSIGVLYVALDILCYSTKVSHIILFGLSLNDNYLNTRVYCPEQGSTHCSISLINIYHLQFV